MSQGIIYHTAIARFLHWTNVVSVGMLALTGFYIHWPLDFRIFSNMDMARKLHFIFMYIAFFGMLLRVYYAWISGDYKDIMFRPSDVKGFPALARYYTFFSKSLPDFGKYNPGQKLTYSGWAVLILVQAATGFILYRPTRLAGLAQVMGGMMVMRMIHYLVTWIFVATVVLHVYLSFLGGLAVIKSIITGYVPAGAQLQPESGEEEE